MFNARVYRICVASVGVAMKEERIAQSVVANWNNKYSEDLGVVFLTVSNSVIPDIYVFSIDNYIDSSKVDEAIATGAQVFLLFSKFHDPKNTIPSELEAVNSLRRRVQYDCVCLDYQSLDDLERIIENLMNTCASSSIESI